MLMLSDPVELLFLLFLIASWTCALVSCMYVVLSLLMFLSTTLVVLLVVCLMVLVNCLLNTFAICLCVVAVLLLKEMVLCCPCMIFHSVCVFCL